MQALKERTLANGGQQHPLWLTFRDKDLERRFASWHSLQLQKVCCTQALSSALYSPCHICAWWCWKCVSPTVVDPRMSLRLLQLDRAAISFATFIFAYLGFVPPHSLAVHAPVAYSATMAIMLFLLVFAWIAHPW